MTGQHRQYNDQILAWIRARPARCMRMHALLEWLQWSSPRDLHGTIAIIFDGFDLDLPPTHGDVFLLLSRTDFKVVSGG